MVEEEKAFDPTEWLKEKISEGEESKKKQEKGIKERREKTQKKKASVRKVVEAEDKENTKSITVQVPRPEPVYYWIVDYWKQAQVNNTVDDVIKVQDWVSASDISQMYFNLRQRQMAEQREARDLLSKSYEVSRAVTSLRNEKRRLKETLDLVKEGKEESLKGIFVDFADREAPGASLAQLETAGKELEFMGIRDLFFAVNKKEEIDKLPTTERVKRIIRRKWDAYKNWQKNAIPELKGRLDTVEDNLRKTKAQAKMYEEWAKPYLTKQKILKMREEMSNPDLAKSFERMVAKTVLMIYRKEYRIGTRVPTSEESLAAYHPVIFLEIYQRAIPQAVYGGSPRTRDAKVEIKIKWSAKSTSDLEDLIEENVKMEEKTLWEIIEKPEEMEKEGEKNILEQTSDLLESVTNLARKVTGLKPPNELEKTHVEKEVLPKMVEDFWESFKSQFGLVSLGRVRHK